MTESSIKQPGGTDPIAWGRALVTGVNVQPQPYRAFAFDTPTAKFTPLMRGDHVALYVGYFGPGEGEVGAHAHDDEAIWFVLEGEATFYGEDDVLIGVKHAREGVLIPKDARYRYVNTGSGKLLMLRAAGRPDPILPTTALAGRATPA